MEEKLNSLANLDFIAGLKLKHYINLFEEFVAIKNQIEATIQEEKVIKLKRSLEHKKAELSKAFDEVAKRIGEDFALQYVKEGVEKFGGYDQLEK